MFFRGSLRPHTRFADETEPLFDQLVRDQVCGKHQPKLPRRVRVDDHLKFRGLHDREIGGFGTPLAPAASVF
jgi:hypothetical protein